MDEQIITNEQMNNITIFNIGKEVRRALLASEELSREVTSKTVIKNTPIAVKDDTAGMLSPKVFPLIAKENTTYPFIVYQKSNVFESNKNKDSYNTNITIDVIVFTASYDDMCRISELAYDAIKKYFTGVASNVSLVGDSENFADDCWFQVMTFQFDF